ncbi:uncharacterized protein LOC121979614 [Zingiber officinale]|uniref:uncharacterized protein LOC121979614 n=1 Tax=Zingiber officinale TaxID=94328 RepID=UPI001C4DD4AF|nr:uncharacterized protein LOC121979614 [Zingiber officinale]
MHAAQSRQKSYANQRRRDLEFAVGDHVFLKVSPMKGVLRFGKKGKLSPRYIGPFEILDRIGTRAYHVALPPNLSGVHNVFHVSMLRRYIANPSHVIGHESMQWTPDLTYEEQPKQILDRQVRTLRNKEIKMVKILWGNQQMEEATWETEQDMHNRYPEIFLLNSRMWNEFEETILEFGCCPFTWPEFYRICRIKQRGILHANSGQQAGSLMHDEEKSGDVFKFEETNGNLASNY